ncbi:hypothetical protein BDV32DRAFT_152886 [Aspergillus pseudonomiae]|nr:hypothetical protein BDV32DRAFT_152886 [Aspergillus pseudonomiae]
MKFYIPLTLLFAALAIAAPAETETDDSVLADTEAAPSLCRDITRYNKCLKSCGHHNEKCRRVS